MSVLFFHIMNLPFCWVLALFVLLFVILTVYDVKTFPFVCVEYGINASALSSEDYCFIKCSAMIIRVERM